jgi:two-component system cell cycle sensor histidine kinase/response regulator CckA
MAPAENGKTILLAEDEQPVRTFVLAMLQSSGYSVITAVDGRDALDKSRQFKGTIDLLLSDVQMPNMTGVELATQIQIERPNMRVLLMSGMTAGMLLLNEGWQFLPKPFMCNMLKDRVRHLLTDQPHDGKQALGLSAPE